MSKIKINGRIQRVKYEALPMVWFECGRFGHNRDNCYFKSDKGGSHELGREQAISWETEVQRR